MEYNNTYKIIKNVHNSGSTALDVVHNNTYEFFKSVHNPDISSLNINVINGDDYWLSTSGGTINGDVIINGDLTAIGITGVTVEIETLLVEDTYIVLNNGEIGSGVTTGTAGLVIDRGQLPDSYFLFNESDDTWHYGISGLTDFNLGNQNYVNKTGDTMTGDLIMSGASIGIGTITPNEILEVQTPNEYTSYFHSLNGVGGKNKIRFALSPVNINLYGASIGAARTGTGLDLIFETSEVQSTTDLMEERMRILSNGNVGIGTTNPTKLLQIGELASAPSTSPDVLSLGGTYSSVAGANPKFQLWANTTETVKTGIGLSPTQMDYILGSTAYDHVFYADSIHELMRIDGATGNVGIGTTSPQEKLHVKSLTNGDGITLHGSSIDDGFHTDIKFLISTVDTTTPVTYIRNTRRDNFANNDLLFHVGGNDAMFIQGDGNVGIGTTSPTYTLEVSGDTHISEDLTVDGDIHYTKTSAQVSSLSGFTATLTDADTYYTLVDIDLSGETLHNMVYSGTTGEIIYTHSVVERILFTGSADIEIDAVAAQLTFAIFLNGDIVDRGKTPTDFTSLDRLKNISINKILELEDGDIVTVRVKSDTAGIDLTVASINLSFWG